MAEPVRVGAVTIPERELTWRFSRSSGPGGQGVNTADSRVELVFDLAGSEAFSPALRERALARLSGKLIDGTLVIAASEYRAQLRNRQAATERLIAILTAAIAPPPPPRRPTRPTRGSTERRLDSKTRRSQTKRLRGSTDD